MEQVFKSKVLLKNDEGERSHHGRGRGCGRVQSRGQEVKEKALKIMPTVKIETNNIGKVMEEEELEVDIIEKK